MGKRIVKNYPSPRLMETIGATNQTTPEAIGELVANCFDARYQDEKLAITIDVRNGSITVIDNGKGMEFSILEKRYVLPKICLDILKEEKVQKAISEWVLRHPVQPLVIIMKSIPDQ